MNPLDRGNKLWEGHRMILPEHEHRLWQERRRQEEYRPPELDPDALEAIGRKIERSFTDREPVGSPMPANTDPGEPAEPCSKSIPSKDGFSSATTKNANSFPSLSFWMWKRFDPHMKKRLEENPRRWRNNKCSRPDTFGPKKAPTFGGRLFSVERRTK